MKYIVLPLVVRILTKNDHHVDLKNSLEQNNKLQK